MKRQRSSGRVRGTMPAIEEFARRMRIDMTPAEQALWEALRLRRLAGLRFRCQHPVGRFILDFYCPARRLAIEVDGVAHEMRLERDLARTDVLTRYGIRVIRFQNAEVMADLPAVLTRIVQAAESSKSADPNNLD